MALETAARAPTDDDYTPLSEHQEQTPGTFFGGKPVLHLRCGINLKISRAELSTQPVIASLHLRDEDGEGQTSEDDQVEIQGIDAWVSSAHLILFSASKNTGAQISYPTITVHAQEGSAVLLGLNLSDTDTADEDLVFIQLRLISTSEQSQQQPAQDSEQQQPNGNGQHHTNLSQMLFKAISDCQELNPDPAEDDSGNEAFDETAPGATGWITSENMQDFVDENGEFRMPESMTVLGDEDEGLENGLGEGAGRTRTAAEVDAADGAEDEAKWQRTG